MFDPTCVKSGRASERCRETSRKQSGNHLFIFMAKAWHALKGRRLLYCNPPLYSGAYPVPKKASPVAEP
eukprot:456561-Pyramimonas_sp.AAC.1